MRSPIARIAVRAIHPMVAGLDAAGYDSRAILARCGLDRSDLADPDRRVPHETMMEFWQAAEEISGDDCVAIHVAAAAPIETFELHSFALLACRNLREAWTRAVRYQRLIHDATVLSFEESRGEAVLRHSLPGGRSVPRQPAEALLALWLRLARMIAGEDLDPRLVRFAHDEPDDTTEHVRCFRSQIVFSSGMTALVIDAQYLDRPNPRADAALSTLMERYASTLLRGVPASANLSDRLRTWLTKELHGGAPTLGEAARALKMSARSLTRALAADGTSYREVLEGLRKETASSLLIRGECSLGEIAFLLGFSELSAFTRAFKRWTGVTPSQFLQEKHR